MCSWLPLMGGGLRSCSAVTQGWLRNVGSLGQMLMPSPLAAYDSGLLRATHGQGIWPAAASAGLTQPSQVVGPALFPQLHLACVQGSPLTLGQSPCCSQCLTEMENLQGPMN